MLETVCKNTEVFIQQMPKTFRKQYEWIRIHDIIEFIKNNYGKIYVTAFLDFKTFKTFSESLAWETEVWIADMPEHMIHLNGDKFLGPRKE